jgi:predicted nucleic acid-binding Zn ribbon protein
MRDLVCKHCGGSIEAGDKKCAHCGMPLPPDFAKSPQKKFTLYFIVLVIFCALVIIWLPPNWIRFIK